MAVPLSIPERRIQLQYFAGLTSEWGPSLLGQVTFPIADEIKDSCAARLPHASRPCHRIRAGNHLWKGQDQFARLTTYFIDDQNPELNRTSLPRKSIGTSRYRVSLQDRTEFTSDIYGIVDITKLSDAFVMQDFYQGEFRLNPVPDNVIAITKTDPFTRLLASRAFRLTIFFHRLSVCRKSCSMWSARPSLAVPFSTKAKPASPTSSQLREQFGLADYESWRLDTFHQFLYPNTYFGWLSIVPRVGFRATYYTQTRDLGKTIFTPNNDPFTPDFLVPDNTPLFLAGDKTRTAVNAGVEASFKISRAWEDAQSRTLGLDGLRHVIQPFTNFLGLEWRR